MGGDVAMITIPRSGRLEGGLVGRFIVPLF